MFSIYLKGSKIALNVNISFSFWDFIPVLLFLRKSHCFEPMRKGKRLQSAKLKLYSHGETKHLQSFVMSTFETS